LGVKPATQRGQRKKKGPGQAGKNMEGQKLRLEKTAEAREGQKSTKGNNLNCGGIGEKGMARRDHESGEKSILGTQVGKGTEI